MKILFATDNPKVSTGYAKTARLTIFDFCKWGAEVFATAFNSWDTTEVEQWNGVTILPNPYHNSHGGNDLYGNAKLIEDYDNKYHFDVIIFHNDSYRLGFIKELPIHIQKKIILWLPFDQPKECPDVNYINNFIPLMKNGLKVNFITKYGCDAHYALTPPEVRSNLGYIRHAIENWDFVPLDEDQKYIAKKELGLENKFVLCRVDKNQHRKNWKQMFEIYSKFVEDKDDVMLICKTNPNGGHGDGTSIDLIKLAEEYGISDKVIFKNDFMTTKELSEKIYGRSDVYMTTTVSEGFGLSIAEAMSCGVSVIAPNHTVIPEITNEGRGAYLVECDDKSWDTLLNCWYVYPKTNDFISKLEIMYISWKTNKEFLNNTSVLGIARANNICNYEQIMTNWRAAVEHTLIKTQKHITIGIVTYNSEEYIEDCIRSIWENTRYPHYDIVVVDNGSVDKTREILNKLHGEPEHKTTLHFLDINTGFSGGCNKAFDKKFPRNQYAVFLNPDTKILKTEGKDWLQLLKDKLEDDPTVGIVGPADIIMYDEDVKHVGFIGLWCAMMENKLLHDIGGMDEKISPAYWEDFELCLRLYKNGYKKASLNQDTFPVWHKNQHAKPDQERFQQIWNRNRRYVLDKWRDYIKELKPVVFSYPKGEISNITKDSRVTIEISTKDRHPYLATLLTSLLTQTFKNWELLVMDNGSDESLIKNEQIMKLFKMCEVNGHKWRCNKIEPMGPQKSHREALKVINTPLTCRIDDDIFLEPDFLQILFNNFLEDQTLAAVGGIYLFVDNPWVLPLGYENDIKNQGKITHLDWSLQVNRHPDNKIKEVEHLHSSFMHRTEVAKQCGSYTLELNNVGFREETEATYRMKLGGYNLRVDPKAIGYHFGASTGGDRTDPDKKLAIDNDKIFKNWLNNAKSEPIKKDDGKFIFSELPELFQFIADENDFKTYLEIGVQHSQILQQLKIGKKIGVDPKPLINPSDCMIYSKTSDDFFEQDADALFKDDKIDMALVDGLHHCEYVLRDFMNCEKHAKNNSIIFLHDCLPISETTQVREEQPYGIPWHGDCWKALKYILEIRPDLNITLFNACQGTAMITNLNPNHIWPTDFGEWRYNYIYERDLPSLKSIAVEPILPKKPRIREKSSIIIGTYNHLEDCLKPCIESILKYTDMDAVEVIVVANGCTDGTREYVESLGEPFKLIWFDEPIGYARANNEGIKIAKYDYVILLNNDTQLLSFQERHGWIDMLMRPFKTEDRVGITGALKTYQEMLKHDFLIFCLVMIKKSLFDELGLLDEKFGEGGGEDTDFCMKAVRAGYKQIQVPHDVISKLRNDDGLIVTNFPLYHPAGVTCTALDNWDDVIKRNNKLLEDRWVKHLDV